MRVTEEVSAMVLEVDEKQKLATIEFEDDGMVRKNIPMANLSPDPKTSGRV